MSGSSSGLSCFKQRHEGMREHFVRTVADEDVACAMPNSAKVAGDGFLQTIGVRVGVEAQRAAIGAQLGLHRARRRAATAGTGSRWCSA